MQRISVREIQHNLASILTKVKSGQEILICHRKDPVARLLPLDSPPEVSWEDHEREIMAIFRGRTLRPQESPGIISETRHEF